jgi:type II secretion system protein N
MRFRQKALRIVGYCALVVLSVLFGFYIHFPATAVAERISYEIEKSLRGKAMVDIEEIDLFGLNGVEAKNVRLQWMLDNEAVPVAVDDLRMRLALMPLLTGRIEVTGSLRARGAKIEFVLEPYKEGKTTVVATLRDLALNDPALVNLVGLPIVGKLHGQVNMHLAEQLRHMDGDVSLSFENLAIGPAEPFPGFAIKDVIDTGRMDLALNFKGGKYELKSFEQKPLGKAPALEVDKFSVSGNLAKNNAQAKFNFCASFKLSDDFLEKEENVDLKRAMSLLSLQMKKDEDGYFHAPVTGDFGFRRMPRLSKRLCPKVSKGAGKSLRK